MKHIADTVPDIHAVLRITSSAQDLLNIRSPLALEDSILSFVDKFSSYLAVAYFSEINKDKVKIKKDREF